MTIGELRDMLDNMIEYYGADTRIVVQGCNSMYADEIEDVLEDKAVRSYWGRDYKALVLHCGSQVGAVWEEDEVDDFNKYMEEDN